MLDEVDAYFEERPISCKESPLAWWNSHSSQFPRLSNLANFFLAIPATSKPSERVLGIVVDRKRCALTPDALVFLNKNSYLSGLTEEEPPAPQAELLLLPKEHEMIEISDNEDDMDYVIAGDEETDASNT